MTDTSHPLRILVVDDEQMIRRALGRVLRPHLVFVAEDYEHAEQVLRANDVDLVISDCAMPGPSGVEVLRLTARLRPTAKRVMLSAHPPDELQQLIAEGLIHRFYAKPWDAEMLGELVVLCTTPAE